MKTLPYKRIMILGNCGAGKSTLALQLAVKLDLPVIHLDQHFWQPGWVQTNEPAWREQVTQLIQADQWIMDGNYSGTWDLRLPTADLVIYLDYSRWLVAWRVIRRYLHYRGRTRPDVASGCPERWDSYFFNYVWHYRTRKRPAHLQRLQQEAGDKLLIFRTPREVKKWLFELLV